MGESQELVTLDAWNRRRLTEIEVEERAVCAPLPNGLACPACGRELLDTKPVYSFREGAGPARLEVHCDHCGFAGSRVQ